jgi:hypothetical protein
MNGKKKTVAGVELCSSSFAYVGNENNPTTWLLPLFVRGDAKKTSNLIASALHRVDAVKGIPNDQRATVRLLLYGAAIAHGLHIDRSKFAAPVIQTAEPPTPAVPVVVQEPIETDPEVLAAIVRADLLADRLLRSLGLD